MNITTLEHNYAEAHPRQQQQLQWGNHKTHAKTKETIHTLLASEGLLKIYLVLYSYLQQFTTSTKHLGDLQNDCKEKRPPGNRIGMSRVSLVTSLVWREQNKAKVFL